MGKNLEKALGTKPLVSKERIPIETEDNGLRDFVDLSSKQIIYLFSAEVLTSIPGITLGWLAYRGIIEGINYLK